MNVFNGGFVICPINHDTESHGSYFKLSLGVLRDCLNNVDSAFKI